MRPALVAAAFFALTLATRLPFASAQLWAWDSVLYARALEDGFHVDYVTANQRPHPPGYLLYVGAAAFARQFTVDSNSALVLISMLASSLAAAALFLFARRFASDRSAALVALGFSLSPLVWHYSEVAYPYTLLALLSIALAACLTLTRGRGMTATLTASLSFGAAAGFRQDLLWILGPLWLWSVWPLRPRDRGAAAGMVAFGSVTWLVPTAILSGGLFAYIEAVARQSDFVRVTHSVLAQGMPALVTNVTTTLDAVVWGLGVFMLPVSVLAIARCYRAIRQRAALGDQETLLLAWILPGLLLYILFHIGEPGYVLSILPALYVAAAIAIDRAALLPRRARRTAFAVAVLTPAFVFTGTSAPFSAAAISRHDWELASRVSYVRENYLASTTLLLAREDFLLVRYYLPEYRTWFHDRDPYGSTFRRKRAPKVNAIVVFTPQLQAASAEALRIKCAKNVELVYLAIEPGAVVELHDDRYAIAESIARR